MTAPAAVGRRLKKPRHRAGLPVGREFRRFTVPDIEVRSAAGGKDAIELVGTPIVYSTPYSVRDWLGEFTEMMMPGAASDVLSRGADVRFLFNHDGMPLARTTSGTLRIEERDDGVHVVASLDARQQLANDLAVAVERGDVSQMSCGFQVAVDDWSDNDTQRSIYKLGDLFDVSAVTYPASPTTSVELALRSLAGMPVESRARVRRLYAVTKQLRAGATLTQDTAAQLSAALEALHAADDLNIPGIIENLEDVDDALDQGQEAIAAVLDVADPDDDDSDDGEDAGTVMRAEQKLEEGARKVGEAIANALLNEKRAQMSTADINDLPDSDFAYIEPGGEKDSEGKTTPRSLRHFPIPDADHVRNALARIAQGAKFGQEALPKVKAAAKKFGIDVQENDGDPDAERRAALAAAAIELEAEALRLRGQRRHVHAA